MIKDYIVKVTMSPEYEESIKKFRAGGDLPDKFPVCSQASFDGEDFEDPKWYPFNAEKVNIVFVKTSKAAYVAVQGDDEWEYESWKDGCDSIDSVDGIETQPSPWLSYYLNKKRRAERTGFTYESWNIWRYGEDGTVDMDELLRLVYDWESEPK